MMSKNRTLLLLTALSMVGHAVNGFANLLKPVSFSVAFSTPTSLQGSKSPASLVCIHMKSSFPEDTGKSTDFDTPSSIPKCERVGPSSEGSPDLTPSDDQFAEYKELDRRKIEFPVSDDSKTIPSSRHARRETDAKTQSRFKSGDELIELRQKVDALRKDLTYAKEFRDSLKRYTAKEKLEVAAQRIKELELSISKLCMQDPEFWYVFMLEVAAAADRRGDKNTAKMAKIDAKEARSCIPQLNMHGLWVGK